MPNMAPRIRPALNSDYLAIAEIHVAIWRSTYQGIVPQPFLDSLSVGEFADRWRDRFANHPEMLVRVAELRDGTCGFVSGGPTRTKVGDFDSELYSIYLKPEYQRAGIGSGLFFSFASALVDGGRTSMYLRVLEQNPSRRFYEKLGGQCLSSVETVIGGRALTELVYGWFDLRAVTAV